MSSGLSNKLTGQIGEYLACAQLGKHGYIATSFTGNVPEFDIIITSEDLITIPIQVKTTRGDNWPTRADYWIDIEINEKNKLQIDHGDKSISNPDLLYICVAISNDGKDRFFILKKAILQKICGLNYRKWMDTINWKRPKNFQSLDNRYCISDLLQYEDNWILIEKEIEGKRPKNT